MFRTTKSVPIVQFISLCSRSFSSEVSYCLFSAPSSRSHHFVHGPLVQGIYLLVVSRRFIPKEWFFLLIFFMASGIQTIHFSQESCVLVFSFKKICCLKKTSLLSIRRKFPLLATPYLTLILATFPTICFCTNMKKKETISIDVLFIHAWPKHNICKDHFLYH